MSQDSHFCIRKKQQKSHASVLTEFWTSQNSLQLFQVDTSGQDTFASLTQSLDSAVSTSTNKLFEVNHTLIIIARRHESHQHHQSAWPARNTQTRIQFQFIFALVFWVVDDTWNWVQRVRCLWFWFSVCAHCNRTVFFVFVHIITVSVVSCKTEDTACFFDCCFKTFL